MLIQAETVTTPFGELTYGVDVHQPLRVYASGWLTREEASAAWSPHATITWGRTDAIHNAIDSYLAGDVHAFDTVECLPPSTPFAQHVVGQMRDIRPGDTLTYGQLAARSGQPRAARAVGSVCSRNHVAPFVPCHRVVPAHGGIGAYGYGPDRKRALLAWESSRR